MSPEFSHNVSPIRELLSHKGDISLHRRVFILAGEKIWQAAFLQDLLSGYENDSLWLGESAPEIFPSISVKKAQTWLGNEKQVVIFDANKDFDPDNFAAISGIVVGGGLFFLLLPEKNDWNEIYNSFFGQRLIQSIHNTAELIVINQSNEIYDLVPDRKNNISSQKYVSPFLTADQQYAVEAIEEQVLGDSNTPLVLISDRGRGKSAALGLVAARLIKAGIKNIAITAPRMRAADIVFKHIKELLPDAVSSRGKVKFGESTIQFYSPDQLIQENIDTDLLLVDEAAGIPVPLLTSYLQKYSQCVYATTVHGYEGTGRGFALRFNKILNSYNPAWIKLHMQTPIRWQENDPLEKWMFSLLCLDAEIAKTDSICEIELSNIKHVFLNKDELANNQTLLNEVFSLLVLAHYRTRPKDLKSLLDDEDLSLYVSLYNAHIVAVALVIREGRFAASLSTDVYRGERRPPGNLLAQALTYHCGIEQAATLDYARIMRIAVHPELQLRGLGTALINYVIHAEKQLGRDAIGTSFGMNKELLKFWNKTKFNVIRIGFTREQTSGEHAAIMLLPLSDKGEKVYQEAISRFKGQLFFWFNDILKSIPVDLKNAFKIDNNISLELTENDKTDLHSFIQYSRNYELCISSLTKLVLKNKNKIMKNDFPENFRQILNEKVTNSTDWKELGKSMNLNGKNDARKLFHRAILFLVNN